MSSSAIEKRDEQIDSLRNRLSNLRKGADAEAKEVMATAGQLAVAYGYGAMERREEAAGRALTSPIDGVPPRVAYGVGAYIAGRMAGGDAGLILQAGGKALLTIHAYTAGRESVT